MENILLSFTILKPDNFCNFLISIAWNDLPASLDMFNVFIISLLHALSFKLMMVK